MPFGTLFSGKATTASSTAGSSQQNIPTNDAKPLIEGSTADADTELAQTVFAMAQARDDANGELKKWNDLLIARRIALQAGVSMATSEFGDIQVDTYTIDTERATTAVELAAVHDQLRNNIGADRYKAWISSRGSDNRTKPSLPQALQGLGKTDIKNLIGAPGSGGSRA